jgi:membrane associated rhomboid family serine protease
MRRRSSSFDDLLSFGGRVPPAVGGIIVAFVLLSILNAVTGLVAWTLFAPNAVLGGQVWRLVTWVLVEAGGPNTPINLLFGGLTLYWFGRDLCSAWGSRRFVLTYFGVATLAALATTLLSLGVPQLRGGVWTGAWPILSALLIAWASLFPERQILLFFALPISGRTLGWITVAGTLLYGVFGSMHAYVPHLLAQGIMALYLRGVSARGLWQSLKIRQLERKARRRASHLKVVHKDGQGGNGRWMN